MNDTAGNHMLMFGWAWYDIGMVALRPYIYETVKVLLDEYRHEAARCRKLAKDVLEDMDTSGVVIEFGMSETLDTGIGLVICAPGLDESNLGAAAKDVLADLFSRAEGGPSPFEVQAMKIMGTLKGDAK